jgi:hypothetical protein
MRTTCAGCGKQINTATAFRGETSEQWYCAAPCPGQHQQFVDRAMGRVTISALPLTSARVSEETIREIEAAIRKG